MRHGIATVFKLNFRKLPDFSPQRAFWYENLLYYRCMATVSSQDLYLIKRLLSRDPSAVKEFYDTYSVLLLRFIRRKVGDEQDVEEIAQDVLFAFLEGARDFAGNCKLSTYLCSIASHKIVDYYRKKKLKRVVFSQLPQGLEQLLTDSLSIPPEEVMSQQFVTDKIASVFKALQPHYAKILTMKYVEGRSIDEIAGKLSFTYKAVESVLFRARKTFVKLYSNER